MVVVVVAVAAAAVVVVVVVAVVDSWIGSDVSRLLACPPSSLVLVHWCWFTALSLIMP